MTALREFLCIWMLKIKWNGLLKEKKEKKRNEKNS